MRLGEVFIYETWIRRAKWEKGHTVKYVPKRGTLISLNGNVYNLTIEDYFAGDWEFWKNDQVAVLSPLAARGKVEQPNVEQPGDPFDLYAPLPPAASTKPATAEPTRDVIWALQQLARRHRVRRTTWKRGVNIYREERDLQIWIYHLDNPVTFWTPTQMDIQAADWEMFKL